MCMQVSMYTALMGLEKKSNRFKKGGRKKKKNNSERRRTFKDQGAKDSSE